MKISVIVPCYNQEAFLDESLASVANQTYTNWECIIVDDGSTDSSALIAKAWQEKDARFKYFYQENKRVSGARNTGLTLAQGDLIQFLDGDDLLQPTKLEESVEAFKREQCDIVVSNFSEIHKGK
ncbi:MAG: glycosyltransferase family 2 protein, partial [Prevotella shahii]|nr:glycosyltransferase family 2 protein [Hoylesella shahii]